MPKTVSASSSFVNSTSTYCIKSVITSRAFSGDQSLRRKFRSQLTVTPFFFAAMQASLVMSATLSAKAGVMPVKWNQCLPSKISSQSIIAGAQFGDRTALAVVEERRRTLRGAGFDVIDAQPKAVLLDVVEIHAELAQVVQAGLADGVVGHAGNHVAVDAHRVQGDAQVRFRAAVDDVELAGLHDALVPLGREPHHQFAEEDDLFVAFDLFHVTCLPSLRGRSGRISWRFP